MCLFCCVRNDTKSCLAYLSMEYEISYRQVGREKGFVHPPRFLDNERQRQSIAERDAFGNRTQRFTELTVRTRVRSCLGFNIQSSYTAHAFDLKSMRDRLQTCLSDGDYPLPRCTMPKLCLCGRWLTRPWRLFVVAIYRVLFILPLWLGVHVGVHDKF